jgi:hypothetical protein
LTQLFFFRFEIGLGGIFPSFREGTHELRPYHFQATAPVSPTS